MVMITNFPEHAQRMLAPGIEKEKQLSLVTEVRESIEIVHTSEYPRFLASILPAFQKILRESQPETSETPGHKTRNVILEVLNRLPQNDVLRPHVDGLMKLAMEVMQKDNEDNALVCLRVIFDLHKNFRPSLQEHAQGFLDFVHKVYSELNQTFKYYFEAPQKIASEYSPSFRSFKVVTECPLIVMFLLQLYPAFSPQNIPKLLPLMQQAIEIQGPKPVLPHQKGAYVDFKTAQVKTVSFLTFLLRTYVDHIKPLEAQLSLAIVNLLITCPDNVAVRKELLVAMRHVLTTDLRKGFNNHLDTLLDERVLAGSGLTACDTLRPLAYSLLAELIHHVRKELTLPQLSRIIYIFTRNVNDSGLPISVQGTCIRLMLNLVEALYAKRSADAQANEMGRGLLGKLLECFVGKLSSTAKRVEKLLKASNDAVDKKLARKQATRGLLLHPLPPQVKEEAVEPMQKGPMLYQLGTADEEKELTDTRAMLQTVIMALKTLLFSIIHYSRNPNPTVVMPQQIKESEVRLMSKILTRGTVALKLFEGRKEVPEVTAKLVDLFTVLDTPELADIFALRMPELFDLMLADENLVDVAARLLGIIPEGEVPKQGHGKTVPTFSEVLAQYVITLRLKDLKDPTSPEGALLCRLLRLLLTSAGTHPMAEAAVVTRIGPLMDGLFDRIREQRHATAHLELMKDIFKALQGCKSEILHRDFQLQTTLSFLRTMNEGPLEPGQKELLVELILTIPARLSQLLHFLPQLMRPLLEAIQGADHLVQLGMKTLEYWVDSLNPEFLEPAMAEVLPELMESLQAQLCPAPYPFGTKALTLLGKLGGRNRRYLQGPVTMDHKDNPEHGLRLILTFEPSTSFLVPLDRCIMLARSTINRIPDADKGKKSGPTAVNIRSTFTPGVARHRSYYRSQALSFLQVCLSSVLNLRSPEDSALPGNGVDKLREMLVGNQLPPHIEVAPQKVDFGVKTKTQLLAEKQVLKTLLASVLGLSHDKDLENEARPFAAGVCRHFALLFAAGVESPPPAPPSSRSQTEPPSAATGSAPSATATPSSGAPNNTPHPCPASLKELDSHIFLDAIVDVLADKAEGFKEAGLDGLETFVDSLLLLHGAQTSPQVKKGGPTGKGKAAIAKAEAITAAKAKAEKAASEKLPPFRSHAHAKKLGYPVVMDQLMPRVVHMCFGDSWTERMGGVAALKLLLVRLPLDYLCAWLPGVARGLFMVMRTLPEHCSRDVAEIEKLVLHTVARCFLVQLPGGEPSTAKPVTFTQEQEFEKTLKQQLKPLPLPLPKEDAGVQRTEAQALSLSVLQVLSHEIFTRHSSRRVRSTVGKCLEIVCSATGRTGAELLQPIMPSLEKKRLLPLRHVEVQIGTALAVTFCLRQKPELIKEVTQDLVQLLQDALTIADVEDSNLAAHVSQAKGDVTATVTRLRTVCVQLLCAAVAWAAFRDAPALKNIRERIISCFFKSLTSPVAGIVAAAKEGLRHVTASQPKSLPKELLQNSLRPLLMNLANCRSLNLPLLKGLAQLLELLSMWFNPNLGDKLLDHLRRWLDPEKVINTPQHTWKQGEEVQVAVAILELFHLLPPLERPDVFLESANKERPGLVVLTIELENTLCKFPSCQAPSKLASPYREPLTKFLNRYALDSIRYFLEVARMHNPHYFLRFLHIVKSKLGEPIRAALVDNPEAQAKLVELLRGVATLKEPDKTDAEFHAVHLVSAVSKLRGGWLAAQKPVLDAVMERWRSPARKQRVQREEMLSHAAVMETARLSKAIMTYLRSNHKDMLILYELLDIFRLRSRVDFTFVVDFLKVEVAQSYTADEKRLIVAHLLQLVQARSKPQQAGRAPVTDDVIVTALRHLVLPVLEKSFDLGQATAILDQRSTQLIVKEMLDPADEVASTYSDPLRVELLNFATLLLKKMPNEIVQHRKELIKFGWNHLKREESSCRTYAFVNVCHFLNAYTAPQKIILQVFVALLRPAQQDTRKAQVNEALDVLVPALPKRMSQGDHRVPVWIRYTKKILVEEGHSNLHMVHIWQMLVRHSDLFYSSRAQFVPQMVNSLSRLGLPTNATSENRRLSIDLASLIIRWEQLRRSGRGDPAAKPSEQRKRGREDEDTKTGEGPSEEPAAKQLKTEASVAIAGIKSADLGKSMDLLAAGEAVPSSDNPMPSAAGGAKPAHSDEEYKPNTAMEEMVVNFLVRMSFLLCDSKDKELQGLVGYCQLLVREALRMWPNTAIKVLYMDKLLQANVATQMDPPPTLVNGLQVIDQALTRYPRAFMTASHQQLSLLIGPAFSSPYRAVHNMLGNIMKKLCLEFPLDSGTAPKEVVAVIHQVEHQVEALLLEAAEAASKPSTPTNQRGLAAALTVLSIMSTANIGFLHRMTTNIVKMVHYHARQQGSLIIQQQQTAAAAAAAGQPPPQVHAPAAADAAPEPLQRPGQGKGPDMEVLKERLKDSDTVDDKEAEPWKPAYASQTFNISTALNLVAHKGRILLNAENKKSFLQTLVVFISGGKSTSPALLLEILRILRQWLTEPDPANGTLSTREAVLFMQRLSQLERTGATSGVLQGVWENTFLGMVHRLSTEEIGAEGEALKKDTFGKVERVFLMGLRACDPEVRAKFLILYNKTIGDKLFQRLQFIISGQDWEALSNRFWITQGLDLLLSILVEDEAITLAPNSAQIPPLLSETKQNLFNPSSRQGKDGKKGSGGTKSKTPKSAEKAKGLKHEATEAKTGTGPQPMEGVTTTPTTTKGKGKDNTHSDLPPKVLALLKTHSEFLEKAGQIKVRNLVRSLREIAHADNSVSYHCWVLIFPIVWATLAKEQQVQLAKPMISLLSKEYHGRQASARPNVVQALLEGISLSQPQPKIPSELIKFLGKTYNAWHIAIPLLESHVMMFQQENRCFDALAELYKQLNEHDVLAGLWKKRCKASETTAGLSLMQHSRWEEAEKLMQQTVNKFAPTGSKASTAVNRGEQLLWVDQWVQAAEQLNHWESLTEFTRDTDQPEILMDSLWKLPDWAGLKNVIAPKAQAEEGQGMAMIRARVALQDGQVSEAQELITHCSFKVLQRWWQLPEVGIWPALPILESLQPLVELHESSRILLELGILQQQRPDHLYSDLKDIMETWRLRLPNEWESLSHWGDVLIWRNHIYNIVINALNDFQDALPNLHQLGYRDKAWSVNQLGAAARKQNQHNVCITSINKLYGYNRMDVQEAFMKIREQAKAYLAAKEELVTGLNLITTTNLEYFTPEHQAELFRLKGLFHQELGENQSANTSFSTALTLHRQLPEAWLSWGTFNDRMFESSEEKSYLESAASCYLMAIRFGCAPARPLLPRVLHLLSFENGTGEVGRALDRQADMPMWVFLVWIPQLLMSLQRPEAGNVKRLLTMISVAFPQAIYYNLRTFLLSLREGAVKQLHEFSNAAKAHKAAVEAVKAAEAAKAAAQASMDQARIAKEEAAYQAAVQAAAAAQAATGEKPAEVVAFEGGREVMEALRSKHGPLVQVLENLLTEIGSRFVPKPAERLLAVVHMLLHRCYKAACANLAEVPDSLKKELGGVCKACFSAEQVSKHGWEMQQHREAFVRDLDPESANFPQSLGQLVERLKGWKATLQTAVEDYMPESLKLEDETKSLQDLSTLDVEMPGQYLSGDHTGAPDQVVKLERLGSDVRIVRRHGSSYRRLKMYGSDGHVRYFLVQTPGTGHWSSTSTSDERVMQLLRLYNQLLARHPDSRRRHLQFHTPAIITIWPQVRLLEEEASYCSCGEAYEVNCARYGREPDLPIITFKDKCCGPDGQLIPDPSGENRLAAYEEIERGVVSENVLSQYMYKTLPSCNHLWTFKKQFCSQMGLSALLCYALQLGGRSPNKILFAKNSGCTFQMDLYPVYDIKGMLECNEPVPFRLTRNLVTFFTPFGVEGVFASSMSTAAAAGLQPNNNLRHLLSMFFRDDIMSAQMRKTTRQQGTGVMSQDLKTLVNANVEQCLKRLITVAPTERAPGDSCVSGADVQQGTSELLKAATNQKKLCRMEPTWHPWF